MKTRLFVISAIVAMLLTACSDQRKSASGRQRKVDMKALGHDSIYTTEYLEQLQWTDMKRTLQILDDAERMGKMDIRNIELMRGLVMINNSHQYRMALVHIKNTLKYDEQRKDTDNIIKTLTNLSLVYNELCDYHEVLEICSRGVKMARKINDVRDETLFLQDMGGALHAMHQSEKAIKYFDQSIQTAKLYISKEPNSLYPYDVMFYSLITKAEVLDKLSRWDEVEEIEEKLADLLKEYGKRYPDHELYRQRVMEFHGEFAQMLQHAGKHVKAIDHYHKLIEHEMASTDIGQKNKLGYLIAAKRYKEAMACLDNAKKYYLDQGDTITWQFCERLESEVEVCENNGNIRRALAAAMSLNSIKDSLIARERDGQAMEMAAIYDTKEKESLLEQQSRQLSQNRVYFIAGGILLVIALIVVGVVTYLIRKVKHRNMAIVNTINAEYNHTQYYDSLQFGNALDMLRNPDGGSVGVIAHLCGFESEETFVRSFENRYGLHPNEYRKLSRKDNVKSDDKRKEEFLNSLSHELRTPLFHIAGFVKLLTDPNIHLGDQEREKFTAIVNQQTTHMSNMLNNFADLSEYDAKPDEMLPMESTTLALVVAEVKAAADSPQEGVSLEYIYPESLGGMSFKTNVRGVKLIAVNLIDNAVKFTTEGYIRVRFDVDERHRRLVITVEDTGKGVDPGLAEQVFERYFKVDPFVKGMGLGLPLARIIAQRLGGNVWLDKAPRKSGAKFIAEVKY